MGILVVDVSSYIPYSEKNDEILMKFANKLKNHEDDREINKLNKII